VAGADSELGVEGAPARLYRTPPRQDLDTASDLASAGLVPAAVVYATWSAAPGVAAATGGVRAALARKLGGAVIGADAADTPYPEPLLKAAAPEGRTSDAQQQSAPPKTANAAAAASDKSSSTTAKPGTKRSKPNFAWLKTG